MRGLFPVLLSLIMILSACRSNQKISDFEIAKKEPVEISAVFKNAEKENDDSWLLVFRRFDNCRYILFSVKASHLSSLPYNFVIINGKEYYLNRDMVNMRFNIRYIESSRAITDETEDEIHTDLISVEKTEGARFSSAGFEDDTEAEAFILLLKNLTRNNDAEKISNFISYPQTVSIKNKKVRISGKKEFINNYDLIFNKKIRDSLLHQSVADMRASSKGIMVGSGDLWINIVNGKIMITAINNI